MLFRGFKSWCENTSIQVRADLGVDPHDPLRPDALAQYLDVILLKPDEIPGLSSAALKILETEEKGSWSAVMVSVNGREAVIYNSTHSPARRTSDIMHELAHIIKGHRPSSIMLSHTGKIALRGYDKAHEDEAGWLAGCLLLPRPALVWIRRHKMSSGLACKRYEVSRDLLLYRMRMTGVDKQFGRASGL